MPCINVAPPIMLKCAEQGLHSHSTLLLLATPSPDARSTLLRSPLLPMTKFGCSCIVIAIQARQ